VRGQCPASTIKLMPAHSRRSGDRGVRGRLQANLRADRGGQRLLLDQR
jgi:hypothetical protein